MTDESGVDAKILAVPTAKLSSRYQHITDYQQIEPETLSSISHFFEHYKDLEANKWVKVDGWADASEAKTEITDSIQRYHR